LHPTQSAVERVRPTERDNHPGAILGFGTTFEAPLRLPAGRWSIEIKLVSRAPERMPSLVLSDWEVEVR